MVTLSLAGPKCYTANYQVTTAGDTKTLALVSNQ